MSFIPWKEEYELGITEIDEQHQKMLAIINKLHDILGRRALGDQLHIDTIIKEMADYAIYHFQTEEKYFDIFGYEQAKEHIAIHNQYWNKVAEWQERYNINKDKAVFYEIFEYLQNWWIWHICHTDRDYVPFFKANGLK